MAGLRLGPSGRLLTGTEDDTLVWVEKLRQWMPAALSNLMPGAPLYNVLAPPFNAQNSLAADDTNALALAILAANANPGVIYLGSRHRTTGALPDVLNNNVTILGRGPFNGGTILQIDSPTGVDALKATGCQYTTFANMWIAGARVLTTGSGVKFSGTYRAAVQNIVITNMGGGVEVDRCTLTELYRAHLGDLYGPFAHYAHGAGGVYNHAVKYRDSVCGTSFPLGLSGTARPWAQSTVYAVGQVVVANGNLYQCSTAGTSAASGAGPSGIPSTNPSFAHSVVIADNSCGWRFAMPASAWYKQGSYSHTFEVLDCGALQGAYGISVEDDAPGSGSAPLFLRTQNFQADHCALRGLRILAGASHRNHMLFVTSVFGGSGVEVGATVGNWEFEGGEIFGCADAGMLIGSGNGLVHGLQIGAVSGALANSRDCVEVASGVSDFTINACSLGNMASAAAQSRYGVSIGANADRYIVSNNRAVGNLTGGYLNTPGVSATRVFTGNLGSIT